MNNFRSVLFLFVILLMHASASWSQVSITGPGTYTESFAGFAGTATPANWVDTATGSSGLNWNGTNQTGGSAGGWYGNNNMSFIGSGQAINGYATWILKNNTTQLIDSFLISFTAQLWKDNSSH